MYDKLFELISSEELEFGVCVVDNNTLPFCGKMMEVQLILDISLSSHHTVRQKNRHISHLHLLHSNWATGLEQTLHQRSPTLVLECPYSACFRSTVSNPGPGGPQPCMFLMSPQSNTPEWNELFISRFSAALVDDTLIRFRCVVAGHTENMQGCGPPGPGLGVEYHRLWCWGCV